MSLRTSILLLAAIVVVSEAQRATVPNLRAECYVGRWYQVRISLLVEVLLFYFLILSPFRFSLCKRLYCAKKTISNN